MEDFPSDSLFLVWCLLALACLVGVALGIRAEGRWFAEHGKRRSWLLLRVCSIPIALSTFGLVIVATRTIGGPEVLKVLYVMLFTAAPVAYFGQHWIAGRWLTPRLSVGESAWIAFSGLLVVVAPPALISALNPWARDAAVFLDILFQNGRALDLDRRITGYHLDDRNDWVAELECGHFQHVRHDPPWINRPWTATEDGRASMLGRPLPCKKCDAGAPPDRNPLSRGKV